MKFLVTGAAGLVGSHICARLRSAGQDVRALVRPSTSASQASKLTVPTVCGDVTDFASIVAAVEGRDCVIHAAANVNYWRQSPALQIKVNVEGTRNVALACRLAGVKRMLHVSSAGAVGIPDKPEMEANEDFVFNLCNSGLVYHISKRLAEEEIAKEVSLGLDAVIVNPTSITYPERIASLLHSARRSPVVPCFSGGNCVVFIDDVIDGILAAVERGISGERYILGGENLPFREMARRAADYLHLSRRFVLIPPLVTGVAAAILEPWARWRMRPPKFAHMIHYCANRFMFYDSGKARRILDYHPRSFDAILLNYLGNSSSESRPEFARYPTASPADQHRTNTASSGRV